MRRLSRAVPCLVVLGLVLPAGALAQDSVVGSGNLPAPRFVHFDVDAHSDADGRNAGGTFTYEIFDSRFQGEVAGATVTCLDVRGTIAVVGVFGTLRRSGAVYFPEPAPPPTPAAFYVFFADNGVFPGGGFEAAVDAIVPPEVVADPTTSSPLTDCVEAQVPAPLTRNVIGEVTVTDDVAPPPGPQSKDDCRRGGYARFGFENQGRCIAAVKPARGARR